MGAKLYSAVVHVTYTRKMIRAVTMERIYISTSTHQQVRVVECTCLCAVVMHGAKVHILN